MWRDLVRVAAAASLWVVATALMTGATMSGNLIVGGWAILFAMWGSIFTIWHLLALERVRAETFATLGARAALECQGLDSIGG